MGGWVDEWMSDENPSILSHVSLGTNDFPKALAFYDKTLAALGIKRVETIDGIAAAYGKQYPEFWVALPVDEQTASVGNGVHIAFIAESKDAVQMFYDASIKAGATDAGAPGPRPHYGEPYYGCFVTDPDGNKIEACYWDMSQG